MRRIEVYWSDLTPRCQAEIEEVIGKQHNYDVFPVATLEFEEEEDDE